ncbi:hypothetical protein TYRP_019437 [Tyrophagus putrescentiae]|nr:hypothetical protein TYRP_019437 [Tyrophagus putrescentiae]
MYKPTNVNVESQMSPINLNFQSSSSPVNINHRHNPGQGSFRQTQSEDEPHRHIHTVTKPIIQEVREIIAPRRVITQQVQPVQASETRSPLLRRCRRLSPDRCRAMSSLWAVLMADRRLASAAETSVWAAVWAAVSAAETAVSVVSAEDEAVWAAVSVEVSAEDEAASVDPAAVWAASAAAWAAATVADEAVEAVALLSTLFAVVVNAYGGGGGGSYGGGGGGGGGYGGASGNLAVITNQRVSYIDTPSRGYAQPTNVNVESQMSPINLNFQSSSSPVNINHRHNPGQGSFRQTQSEDEPHRLIHTVTKPIIQEVIERIVPRRIITQQEEVQTIVARQVQTDSAPTVQALSISGGGNQGLGGGLGFGNNGLGGNLGGTGNGVFRGRRGLGGNLGGDDGGRPGLGGNLGGFSRGGGGGGGLGLGGGLASSSLDGGLGGGSSGDGGQGGGGSGGY